MTHQLYHEARIIASAIARCPTEERWTLYAKVSQILSDASLNYQASHFRVLADAEMEGKQLYSWKRK